jgi:hypothetical protein
MNSIIDGVYTAQEASHEPTVEPGTYFADEMRILMAHKSAWCVLLSGCLEPILSCPRIS